MKKMNLKKILNLASFKENHIREKPIQWSPLNKTTQTPSQGGFIKWRPL